MKNMIPLLFITGIFITYTVSANAGNSGKAPTTATLDSLSDKYEPVIFDHAKHTAVAGDCGACHHRHGNFGALPCRECHALDPSVFRHSAVNGFTACRSCHGPYDPSNPRMPGLKTANHQQCFKGHRALPEVLLVRAFAVVRRHPRGDRRRRIIHRIAGTMFACLAAQHIVAASCGVMLKKWPSSILTGRKDFADAMDNLKYYFGMTNRPARCDRYDYKQKVEYWGILAGGLIMIATGLTLWFPTFVAAYMPGSVIPAAKALHTNVAMMIFLITALWHVYNSIFSPDVFPVDTAMFTGKISVDRMMKEHPIEFERLYGFSLEDGELEVIRNDIRHGKRRETGS